MCPPRGTSPRAPLRLKMGCLWTSSWALWGKHGAREGAGKAGLMRREVWRKGGAYRKGEIILLIKGQIGPRGWEVILYAYKVWRVWLVQSNRDLCWCQMLRFSACACESKESEGEMESIVWVWLIHVKKKKKKMMKRKEKESIGVGDFFFSFKKSL